MIEKMNTHYSMTNPASIYDEEALTALELAGRTTAKVNECVEKCNETETETREHLASQDLLIENRMDAQDEAIPVNVTNEVQKQINDGTFDKAIDKYAGNLENRVDNLLGSVTSGSTTMDAEIIDGRTGEKETYANLGNAVRDAYKKGVSSIGWSVFLPTTGRIRYVNPGMLKITGTDCFYAIDSYSKRRKLLFSDIASALPDYATLEDETSLTINLGSNTKCVAIWFNFITGEFKVLTDYYDKTTPDYSMLLFANYYGSYFGFLMNLAGVQKANFLSADVEIQKFNHNTFNSIYVANRGTVDIVEKNDSDGSSLLKFSDTLVVCLRNRVAITDNKVWEDISTYISDYITIDGAKAEIKVPYRYFLVMDVKEVQLKLIHTIPEDEDIIMLYGCGWNVATISPVFSMWMRTLITKHEGKIGEINASLESGNVVVNDATNRFNALFNMGGECESFAFFTDPHVCNSRDVSTWTTTLKSVLTNLKQTVDSLSLDFVMGGGDWYGMMDSQENACTKLSAIAGAVKSFFPRFYQVLGNHDTNYQGGLVEGDRWTGRLNQDVINNLWYRDTKKAYYTFKGSNTTFYVFDTGTEAETVGAYHNEQLLWFADALRSETGNIALAYHIHFYQVKDDGTELLQPMTAEIVRIANAYNNRASVTVNGQTFNYTGATGNIRFALTGHTHRDNVTNVGTFPVVETLNAYDHNTTTAHFDLCYVDYTRDKLHLIRCGTGEDRVVNI